MRRFEVWLSSEENWADIHRGLFIWCRVDPQDDQPYYSPTECESHELDSWDAALIRAIGTHLVAFTGYGGESPFSIKVVEETAKN